ncbi:TetR/AcrR family transcriptional regulator [Paenibacillus ginsengarvi]|uniref:TetR/AcrR family transcriptional regulator n=1 Tax=Paenibacillus ginsengarvi TaxID=400777 RepID=A0A3B0CL26_9BACL|nr:TetR/AcrR family transcriptional regulator [Paenibacillus ginsengarvi]RKN85448.1 TetR/AcrR family transcriptional regulator [Paenibacillus ginsengarvi]
MSPEERQTESVQDERSARIKRAALQVFAKHGLAGAKMSMIAAEAGVSQGLSYRYYSSKEELFALLVEEAIEEAQAALRDVKHGPGTPFEQIRAMTIRMLDDSHKHYFMLMRQAQSSDDVPDKVKRLLQRYSPTDSIEHVVPVFVQGQQDGQFGQGDARELLLFYFSVISGLMLQDVPASPSGWSRQTDRLMKLLT